MLEKPVEDYTVFTIKADEFKQKVTDDAEDMAAMDAVAAAGVSTDGVEYAPKAEEPAAAPAARPQPPQLPEQTYRYDGPRPRFKESAIIHLADGIEAAARCLPKITPQHLDEIIDQIVRDRLQDGQLDESPLTFAELNKIKDSFQHTLVSMLHGRVAYPAAKP